MHLELRDIRKAYANQAVPAIQGVSLDIRSKRITALAGESGSGKTTLLRLIAGFEQPDAGTISCNGRCFSGDGVSVPPQERSVAMIFQDLALFPHLTAEANVAFAMKQVRRNERARRAREVLASTGMAELSQRYPHELSGGQRQRVALARALASHAETILMDEPFSNLDPELKWNLMAEMRDLLKREEKTVVFVTHDREEALTLADDIALIRDGKLLQSGPAAEVYRSPASHAVARFFGPVNSIPAGTTGEAVASAGPAEMLVRPEHCKLRSRNGKILSPAGPGEVIIAGSVRRSRFMGEYWEIEVTPDASQSPARGGLVVRGDDFRETGEPVWVVVPAGANGRTR